jgi:heme exporter protein D
VYWSSVGDFLAMGGYGAYVWGAYGVSALALIAEVLALRARARRLAEDLALDRVLDPTRGPATRD